MIDSKIMPQPGEGINTNNKGPGVQKEEPGAGAALPDGAPDFDQNKDQVRTRTTERLDCARDKVFDSRILVRGLARVVRGEGLVLADSADSAG